MSIINIILLHLTAFFLALAPVPTFTEGSSVRPASFFPSNLTTPHERTVSTLIYRSLFKYDIYGVLNPDLADTWSIGDDGLSYTIKLKDNQYWTDGKKIDADDLIYTSYKVADLAGVATDKVDDLTVRYTLPNKYSPFLSLLTIGVMHTDAVEKESPLIPISSGDWRVVNVESLGKKVNKVVLRTTNTKYAIKKIVFKYYPNDQEIVTAAKLGEVDGFLSADEQDVPGFTDYKFPQQGIYYALYFNLTNEKFNELALRQNMQKVLKISDLVFDKGIPVEGAISRSAFTDRDIKFDKYDPAFSTDLNKMQITITLPDIPSHVDLVNRIKAVWEDKLGLDVNIVRVPPDQMVDKVITPRNFEILFYGQEVGRDPDRYVNWHSTQKLAPGLNISGFEQVRADRALEEGRKELDNDKRVVHYNEFQKEIDANTPAIFLYHPFQHYYISNYITGIGEKYTFTLADRFLDIVNWKRIETN